MGVSLSGDDSTLVPSVTELLHPLSTATSRVRIVISVIETELLFESFAEGHDVLFFGLIGSILVSGERRDHCARFTTT